MASGPATVRRRTNARVRREEARERIVAAAEQLLLEVPYRDLTVDLVMTRAGLSRTVFYRHFDGLPEVLLTLLSRIEAAYCAVVDRFTTEIAEGMGGGERAYELARALNLMNGHYLMDTLGKDPDFDRELALDTLLAVWGAVVRA